MAFHPGVTTRIILADDHRILREGLRSLLVQLPGVDVIAEADDGRVTVELALRLVPNVVIMDVAMPSLNGIEATRQILAACPQIKVIALSMHSDVRYVSEMLKTGASGYLLKDTAFEELARALDNVNAGRTYLSPGVSHTVVQDYIRKLQPSGATNSPLLTPREKEVLQLLAEGHSTKEIAAKLQLSVKTADAYRQQIMDKLSLRSVAELTKYAIREGLTSLEF